MSTAFPQAERTVVLMLGGSTYPNAPSFNNLRFKNSAEALRDYFLNPAGFNLPSDNLLWLFDAIDNPSALNDKVEEFLQFSVEKPMEKSPQDVIVFFIGHGFLEADGTYYLATSSYRKQAPEYSYSFKFLQRTVKTCMRQARKYYLLDACFSASAVNELMSVDTTIAKAILSKIDISEDLPKKGTAALCAASKDDFARAPETDEYTMFSGALLSVLKDSSLSAEIFSLKQLHGQIKEVIRDRFHEKAVYPEIHVPDQRNGDIGQIPLFPRCSNEPKAGAVLRNALLAETFADRDLVHTVVICHASRNSDLLPPLMQVVSDSWNNYQQSIITAVNVYRAGCGATPVPGETDEGFVIAHLPLEQSFASAEDLEKAVAALCRAEVAVFDLTGWDAGATFLLGVRAVARRGVTVTSVGGDFKIGDELNVPFNLQLLNLAAHSDAQENQGDGRRPYELIGEKIARGFEELANLPHYLDLPAYDSVRQLGVESSAYRPVQAHERVLILCPFNPSYSQTNLRRLNKVLPSKIQVYFKNTESRNIPRPSLVRLLDLKTPRLVAQTLFESIRLTDMCIIDWSEARTNVVFEAGVRMATNPLGAVHVIEQSALRSLRSGNQYNQVQGLLRLFDPIEYSLGGTDTRCFDEMVRRFDSSVEASSHGESNFVYTVMGSTIDHRSQPTALPLLHELIRNANILDPEDQESTGISPILYNDVNRELALEASEAAGERRLAAWLFLTKRYSIEEIIADTVLLERFELLSLQVRRFARRINRDDLQQEIHDKLTAIKVVTAQRAEP